MPSQGLFHWSKDFVEHLRAVHFALAVVSIILIISAMNGMDPRLSVALTQIQQIAKFEQQWPTVPQKIYDQALLDNKLPDSWSTPLALKIPAKYYVDGEIDTYTDVPKQTIIEPAEWKFNGFTFPDNLSTLSDFKEFWNQLNKGVVLVLPEEPSVSSICDERIQITEADGSVDVDQRRSGPSFAGGDLTCKYGVGLTNTLGGPRFKITSELNSHDDPKANLSAHLGFIVDLPLNKAQKQQFSSLESFSIIDVRLRRYQINEHYLARLFFSDWKPGNFDTAFPEVNTSVSGIGTLAITDAVRRIESAVATSQRDVSLLGFSVPISQLSKWGVLILFSVQLYFWLHLHELVTKIEPAAEGWDVAWIGLYAARASFVVAVISSCVLPVAATVTLAAKIFNLESYYRKTALAAATVMVIASVILSILTGRKALSIEAECQTRIGSRT